MNSVSILYLEDNELDVELVQSQFDAEGMLFSLHHVDNRSDFEKALTQNTYDIVLTDYSLPSFSGLEALELAKKNCPNLPVIIVSGNLGEEAAIETLKKGATDYVLKQRLQRLNSAVKRALKEANEYRERILAIKALKESEERFRKLFEFSNDAILLHSAEGKLFDVNQNTASLLKQEKPQILRLKLQDIFNHKHRIDIDTILNQANEKNSASFKVELLIDNDLRWLEVAVSLIDSDKDLMQTIVKDVTDKKQVEKEKESLQNQLLQSQKMEAIGTLAGGVAHDFNNLLTVIQGYIDLALLDSSQNDPHFSDFEQIKSAAQSAASLTRQLLMFSRKQPMDFMTLNLNRIIENLVKMLDRLIGERIQIRTSLSPTLFKMKADIGCLEQVLMNLVVNAKDAMPDGGSIDLITRNVKVDSEYCKHSREAREGDFICLEVKDTGIGMNESIRQHIFEPFYSTKATGKGTGLGLSVVFGIVKQHHGWIELESEPEMGTIFKLFFPAYVKNDKIPDDNNNKYDIEKGNGETILVVEDEDCTRNFIKQALELHQYKTVEAGSCEEAEQQFHKHNQEIELLFSDIILPDGTGVELSRKLKKVRPDLHTLFTSGYTYETIELPELRKEGILFLQKPFEISKLLELIRKSLNLNKREAGSL